MSIYRTVLSPLILFLINSQQVFANFLRDPATIVNKADQEHRPIIYTFFELKENTRHEKVDSEPFRKLLQLWTDLWTDAGWEPRILTMDDAKRHPDYEKYSKAIATEGNLFEGGYEHMCFMRWLAMAAHDTGGWMCDNDSFPMGITTQDGLTLPNDGQFTSFERHVPSLLSGSADEWNRMSKYVLEFGIEKIQHQNDYTDMFALLDINNHDPNVYISEIRVFGGFPYKEKNIVDCERLQGFISVHISHAKTHQAIESGLVSYTGGEDVLRFIESSRPELVRDLDRNWREQCLHQMTTPRLRS